MSNMLLMMKDIEVMRINFDEGIYDVLNENLLPFDIKGRLKEFPQNVDFNTKYGQTQLTLYLERNRSTILNFLSHRVLPISRSNAKKIYNLFGFSQLQDEISKAKIALVCKAVSLQDNYWLKAEYDKTMWKDVDLRTNHLNEVVAQVSLHGSSLSLTGKICTPELTGQGAYAKAWKREEDGLYLHKVGSFVEGKDGPIPGSWESKVEVMVSNLLDICNVTHLKYEASSDNDIYTCKCKCMTTDDISILPGMDFISWCNIQGIDSYQKALEIDADSIYKMWIVDYLISNRDRHGLNWGFFYNCNTMEILGCHPLYDHNNSFDIALMQDKDAPYLYDSRMTMRQAAKEAMKHVDFYFKETPTREMFLTERQFLSFMERAKELNIRIQEKEMESSYEYEE